MAENRKRGNLRQDNPNSGRNYLNNSLSFNKFNLPVVTEGWEGYVLTVDNDGIVSLTLGGLGTGSSGTSGTSGVSSGTGTSGTSGSSGTGGTAGISGESKSSGTSGESGT